MLTKIEDEISVGEYAKKKKVKEACFFGIMLWYLAIRYKISKTGLFQVSEVCMISDSEI